MTELNLPPQTQSIVTRVKGILLKPNEEWAIIDGEQTSIQKLYVGYALILAAIPALAAFLGFVISGWGVTFALSVGISNYVGSLIGVGILGLVIEFLAPQFGAEKNRIAAFKVAVYSMTAAWVGGIFYLLPALGILAGLAGLYGLYLLYLGLPKLMKAPAEKVLTYTIVVVIAALVINIVVAGIIGGMSMGGRYGGLYSFNDPAAAGRVSVPGYGSVDLNRAEAASKAADAAIASALAAQGTPNSGAAEVTLASLDQLNELLPGTVVGYLRGERTFARSDAAGMRAAQVRADYKRGDSKITLSVTDLGRAAAFAQLGSAFDVNHAEQTGQKYEKIGMVAGRLTTEKYDGADRSGSYAVVVAERFMVEASGTNVDMTALKAAVTSVGFAHLETLARKA